MRSDVRDRWAAALESAQYPQTKGRLILKTWDGEIKGYCCLGVLCEIAVEDGVIDKVPEVPEEEIAMFNPPGYYLPEPVREWAGIDNTHEVIFSALNDTYNYSFSQIAEIVRESPTNNKEEFLEFLQKKNANAIDQQIKGD